MKYQRSVSFIVLGAVAMFTLPGCMNPEKIKADMKAKMANRPAELDNLNMWVGTWEGTFQCKMMGMKETMTSKGTSVVAWQPDKRIITEHSTWEMPDWGTMRGVGAWNYDADAKKYRMAWLDGMGMVETGCAKYCPDTKTWHMKAKSNWGHGCGTVTFTDANTMEWKWVVRGPFWMKIMEMTGTSKRKA